MPKKVEGYGNSKAKIMVVGEAPGRNEELEGKPFVGAAGQLLKDRMMAAGINPSDCYFTNIAKYRPPGNELKPWFDKHGIPNDTILEGMAELREEIAAVNPNVLVAVGNYPLWALTGKARWKRNAGYTGISDWRGSIIDARSGLAPEKKVVATYHPAAILRKYSWMAIFDLDLARVKEQSAFPHINRLEKNLVVNPQGMDREYWRQYLLDNGDILTFDIEQMRENLFSISFAVDKDNAVCIRTKTSADIDWCRELLLSGKGLCAQNGMFDCSMLEYWHRMPGIIRSLKHDTMLASHAAYIELPKDLGFLCSVYTEQPCYWDKIDWARIRKQPELVDREDFLRYNAIDAWVTHDVMLQQKADELQDPRVKKTFDFEMGLLEPLWEMSRKGMRIDVEKMKAIHRACETAIEENSVKLEALIGHPINTNSRPQVAKLLFEELGLPVQKKSEKTNAPSADDKVLAALDLKATTVEQRYAIRSIREIRKNRSLISKFTEIEFDADRRMRCHYSPAGTTTGRLSSKKFYPTGTGANLQNIPRDKRVRSVFVPDPGKIFFYNDLERAESMVVAYLTGDPLMLAHHQPGVDAHVELAKLLFESPEITDEKRYMGKQTRHAGNYMEGWKTFMDNVNKIAASTGVSIDAREAKFFINRYRELHPYLPQWWRWVEAELRKPDRTLYNLLGRPRKFYDRISQIVPTAVAYIPQSTIGDVLNIGLQRCHYDDELRRMEVELLVQVHDAIGGQVPKDNALEAMKRMKELMAVELEVPRTGEKFTVPVEIQLGPSWGEVKKIEL